MNLYRSPDDFLSDSVDLIVVDHAFRLGSPLDLLCALCVLCGSMNVTSSYINSEVCCHQYFQSLVTRT